MLHYSLTVIMLCMCLCVPRVFYIIDLTYPTKKEILLHEDDKVHPPSYDPSHLCSSLCPEFKNRNLNTGAYEKVSTSLDHRVCVYGYKFTKTEPANKANSDSIDYPWEVYQIHSIETVLPRAVHNIEFSEFKVPKSFVPDTVHVAGMQQVAIVAMAAGWKFGATKETSQLSDLIKSIEGGDFSRFSTTGDDLSMFREIVSSGRGETGGAEALLSNTEVQGVGTQLKVPGNEDTRNQVLCQWLGQELNNLNLDFVTKPNPMMGHTLSRHESSKEDFSWYIKPTSDHISAGVIAEESEPECEPIGGSGECKDKFHVKDEYQLLANMNKTAADIGYAALMKGILFNKITVYGLLVNYCEERISVVYKLEMDFRNSSSDLKRVESPLSITEGIVRTTSLMISCANLSIT